jgi:DNA-binding response OmpR family regulator
MAWLTFTRAFGNELAIRWASMPRETILVVDDEEPLRALMSTVLSRAGYKVLVASEYDEAVAVHRQNREHIDLLLTDIGLPGRNGFELADKLLGSGSPLKVLYISGYAAPDVFEQNGRLLKGASFLAKPFRLGELLFCVDKLLTGCAPANAAVRGHEIVAA